MLCFFWSVLFLSTEGKDSLYLNSQDAERQTEGGKGAEMNEGSERKGTENKWSRGKNGTERKRRILDGREEEGERKLDEQSVRRPPSQSQLLILSTAARPGTTRPCRDYQTLRGTIMHIARVRFVYFQPLTHFSVHFTNSTPADFWSSNFHHFGRRKLFYFQ